MIAVSDTGPIRNLALLGRIDLLGMIFERVLVASEVQNELTHPHSPSVASQVFDGSWPWLYVRHIETLEDQWPKLDMGERATLALARFIVADVMLTDDQRARSAVSQLEGVSVSGTFGVLYLAARSPLIKFSSSDFDAAAGRLLNDPGIKFRSDPKLRGAVAELSKTLHSG